MGTSLNYKLDTSYDYVYGFVYNKATEGPLTFV